MAPVKYGHTCFLEVARIQMLTISIHYWDQVVSKATMTVINKTQNYSVKKMEKKDKNKWNLNCSKKH